MLQMYGGEPQDLRASAMGCAACWYGTVVCSGGFFARFLGHSVTVLLICVREWLLPLSIRLLNLYLLHCSRFMEVLLLVKFG